MAVIRVLLTSLSLSSAHVLVIYVLRSRTLTTTNKTRTESEEREFFSAKESCVSMSCCGPERSLCRQTLRLETKTVVEKGFLRASGSHVLGAAVASVVMQFLTMRDIGVAAAVSKSFAEAAGTRMLWQHLLLSDASFRFLPQQTITDLVKRAGPRLLVLNLDGRQNSVADSLLHLLARLQPAKLRYLSLRRCPLVTADALAALLPHTAVRQLFTSFEPGEAPALAQLVLKSGGAHNGMRAGTCVACRQGERLVRTCAECYRVLCARCDAAMRLCVKCDTSVCSDCFAIPPVVCGEANTVQLEFNVFCWCVCSGGHDGVSHRRPDVRVVLRVRPLPRREP